MKIAILADIHEDFFSLSKALKIISGLNCNKIICLGDIVGFSPPYYNYLNKRDASMCTTKIKEVCEIATIGNHDLFAIKKIPHYLTNEFVLPSNWFNMDYIDQKKISKERIWLYENELNPHLAKNDKTFLRSLNQYEILKCETFNILFSHYLYPDLTGSSQSSLNDKLFFKSHESFMKQNKCNISFIAHLHLSKILHVYQGDAIITNVPFNVEIDENSYNIIVVPSIANGMVNNGFLLFDVLSKKITPYFFD